MFLFGPIDSYNEEWYEEKKKEPRSEFEDNSVANSLMAVIFIISVAIVVIMILTHKSKLKDSENDNKTMSIPTTNETTDIQQNDTTDFWINKENEKKSILTVINGRWVIIEPTDSL